MKARERSAKNARDNARYRSRMKGYQSEGDYLYAQNKARAARHEAFRSHVEAVRTGDVTWNGRDVEVLEVINRYKVRIDDGERELVVGMSALEVE